MKPAAVVTLGLVFLLLAGACATLPPIVPDEAAPLLAAQAPDRELERLFPTGSFQFVHSLELTLPGNHSAMFLGILNIRSRTRAVHCVVMTLEGLVLFEADYTDDILVIVRGIPPFDAREFALGLIRDIRLIFFRPEGRLLESGLLSDHRRIFRFSGPDSGSIDLIISRDRSTWTLNGHDKKNRLMRTVRYGFQETPAGEPEPRFPATLTLTAVGPSGYTLTMTLLDVHLIPDSNQSR